MKKNNKGFSLVELIVVIAIMAVLTVVLAPAYLRYVEKARLQKDISAIGELVQAIKVAAAEKDAIDAIPTIEESEIIKTKVKVAAETGAVSVVSRKEKREYFEAEVRETIGDKIEFKSEDFVKHGLELSVTKDENYIIYVSIETYSYSDTTKVALQQFGLDTYDSPTKVAHATLDKWTQEVQDSYNNDYWEAYAKAENNSWEYRAWKLLNWGGTKEKFAEEFAKGEAMVSLGQKVINTNKPSGLEDEAEKVFGGLIDEGMDQGFTNALDFATDWLSDTITGLTPGERPVK